MINNIVVLPTRVCFKFPFSEMTAIMFLFHLDEPNWS